MTGHDTIKQLREMEQKAAKNFRRNRIDPEKLEILCDGPGDCVDVAAKVLCFAHRNAGEYIEHDTTDLIIELRNNADLLLSIAEAFQPGDDQIITVTMGFLRGCGVGEQSLMMDCMRRLQAAAERLEECPITASELGRLAKIGTTGEEDFKEIRKDRDSEWLHVEGHGATSSSHSQLLLNSCSSASVHMGQMSTGMLSPHNPMTTLGPFSYS